jgi:hypothetical protein
MTHMVERIVPVDPVGAALGVGSGIVTLSLRQVGRSQSEDMSGARNPRPSEAIRGNQWPSEAIRGHPRQSDTYREPFEE